MSRRNVQLAKIHIARQQLGMDEDSYRDMLQRVAGVRSAADLNPSQAHAVLAELQRMGFAPRPTKKSQGKPHNLNAQSMPAMMTKVEALLADMQLPWAYADGIAKQMFGIERCAWIRKESQLKALIAALYNRQKKTQKGAGDKQ